MVLFADPVSLQAPGPAAGGGRWPCDSLNSRTCFDRTETVVCPAAFAKVLRRPAYKGSMGTSASLPVDGTTVLGTVMVIACILPVATLSSSAVQECLQVLRVLERCLPDDIAFALLPHSETFLLRLSSRRVKLEDVRSMMRELGLQWGRSCLVCVSVVTVSCWESLLP